MKINSKLNFGKYKGFKIIDVFRGNKVIDNTNVRDYIDFLLNKNSAYQNEFIGLHDAKIFYAIDDFVVSNNHIDVKGITKYLESNSDERVKIGNIELVLKNYLNGSFNLSYEPKEIFNFLGKQNASGLKIIGPNPQYLSWCIENISDFFIDSEEITSLQETPITYFKGVDVKYLGSERYSFTPIFETKKYIFSSKTLDINNKIEDYMETEFEYLNDHYSRAGENPWEDVFGEGDEADAAYWNTD